MPRMADAAALAASAPSASFTPPALPRPPAWTCALTTTLPPNRSATARASAGVDEIGGGLDLGPHAAGAELFSGEQMVRLRQRQAADRFLVRRPIGAIDGIHIRQDQQYLRLDFPPEDRGDPVLVRDRINALETELGVAVHGRPAAPAGDHNVPGPRQITDHFALHDPRRLGAGSEPAPIAHRNAARDEPRLAHRIEDVADGLGRRTKVGIIGVTQRLRDERDDGT